MHIVCIDILYWYSIILIWLFICPLIYNVQIMCTIFQPNRCQSSYNFNTRLGLYTFNHWLYFIHICSQQLVKMLFLVILLAFRPRSTIFNHGLLDLYWLCMEYVEKLISFAKISMQTIFFFFSHKESCTKACRRHLPGYLKWQHDYTVYLRLYM